MSDYSRVLLIQALQFCFIGTLSCSEPIIFPQPTGPYTIGTKSFELCDCSRQQLRGSGGRRWMVQAWYPAHVSKGLLSPYMPLTLKDGEVYGIKVLAYAQPEAALQIGTTTFPLIIFQHGFGEVRQSYTILCEELASHGYIVFSLDQAYNSSFVRFPNGDCNVPTLYDTWKLTRDRSYRYNFYDKCMNYAIEDISYVLSHLDKLNKELFSSSIATDFILLMGHSFGGNVAHTLGFANSRIKAIVDIDSKITEKEIYGRVGVPPNTSGKPVLFIRSNQYQEDTKDLDLIAHASVVSFPVEHSAFRDIAFLVRHIPSLKNQTTFGKLWNWFWLKGPLFDPVDTSLGNYSVDNWFTVYRTTIVSWVAEQHANYLKRQSRER